MAGAYFYFGALSEVAFLPALAGLCLCLGGWRLLRIAGPSIAYLLFMLPLPFSAEVALANPLQRLATVASTYLLQTCGLAASAEGNRIVLSQPEPLNVAEACSGLGMMMTFCAMATAVAIVLKRPLLDKIVVVVSALPVAVAANVFRITLTGILYETVGTQVGNFIYHDLVGLLVMMPVALLLIWLELKILSRLLVETEPKAPIAFGLTLGLSPMPASNGHKTKETAIVKAGNGEERRSGQFRSRRTNHKRGPAK
jgi:exosortase